MNEYLIRLHSDNKSPCVGEFVPAIGRLFLTAAKEAIEKELGINGQLDALLKKSGITMSAQDHQRHFWHVYATFPGDIRKYVIPRGRVMVDDFAFDKATLTPTHIAKINAIARHAVDIAAHANQGFAIDLAGHADDRGTEKYNADLGLRRASEVKEALRKAIDRIRPGLSRQITLAARSFGETKPLVKANTEAEHARNRRVEALLPTLRPYCKRVSLRAVVKRAVTLLPRLTGDQANRIRCVLHKVIQKGTDDRWAPPELVLSVYNNPKPGEKGPFPLLRDQFSIAGVFGPAQSDVSILKSMERIDAEIIRGMGEVNKYIQILSGAGSQGVPLLRTMKAMDELRAWMHGRVQDDKSIYSCYRNV